MKSQHKFNYNWTLKDTKFTKDKGKVFSCFACGGGSTMGYKLAGFDVIGFNEIDKKMADAYVENHKPKFAFVEPIQTFKLRKDLPKELYNLDILDGSPPCSSFSMVGNREKDWGVEKKFREGQACQVLDDLFFHFIDLAKELKPKIVVAENVKGILLGNAIKYVREIYKQFDDAGYYCQHWLLNASKMGVPQRRERVFFIALRKDLAKPFLYQKDLFEVKPKLELEFNEKLITVQEIIKDYSDRELSKKCKYIWEHRKYGDKDMSCTNDREWNKPNSWFNYSYIYHDKVANTITSSDWNVLFEEGRHFNHHEISRIGSFPLDYKYMKNKEQYLIGMSVPPVMMAQISTNIYEQWLSKLK